MKNETLQDMDVLTIIKTFFKYDEQYEPPSHATFEMVNLARKLKDMTDTEHIPSELLFDFTRDVAVLNRKQLLHLEGCKECRELASSYRRWNKHVSDSDPGRSKAS